MKKTLVALSTIAALATGTAQAEGWAIGAKTSTLGNGFEVTRAFTPKFNARVGYQTFSMETEQTLDNINYQAAINLDSASVNADWHPFANGFRMTAGVLINGNEITGTASDANPQTIELGGNTYSTSDVVADAKISFAKSSPYIGLGYDRTSTRYKGLSFNAEFGVAFHGTPVVDINVTETENSQLTAEQYAQLLNVDIKQEVQTVEDELSAFTMWPVASIGLAYVF
ncbi:MAG: hypothetical protein ACWA44_13600 [Thiotrichales bacterium]